MKDETIITKSYFKDKVDFEKNYDKFFAERVFWKDAPNGKVEIKVAMPIYVKEVKRSLLLIKD